jgi:(1->4)-alpha-D-glucan 1-alpha-D-glucosylmutase
MPDPRATYRLQLHAGFTFADAAAAVPYLAELGISHLYLSPILAAAKGSTHGYDVVDPERINDELGGADGFAKLVETARTHGMGILLDIVPNHMSVAGKANRWWLDVLENGPSSYYAHYFDVDWSVGDDRVLLPVLGERYGRAIQSGVIRVAELAKGRLAVLAHDHELPVTPRSLGRVVRRAADRCGNVELAFIGDALAALPAPTRRDIDARLVAGAALFGVGWGLAGYCPGPGVTSLVSGSAPAVVFVVAMLGAMWVTSRLEHVAAVRARGAGPART